MDVVGFQLRLKAWVCAPIQAVKVLRKPADMDGRGFMIHFDVGHNGGNKDVDKGGYLGMTLARVRGGTVVTVGRDMREGESDMRRVCIFQLPVGRDAGH